MWQAFKTLVWQDILFYQRRPGEWGTPILFFLLFIFLFVLALGPDSTRLSHNASGIIWVTTTLAILLSVERSLYVSFEEGCLEQLLFLSCPLSVTLFAKACAYWLAIGGPLSIIASLTGIFLHLPFNTISILCLTLLLGIPVLILLAMWGSLLLLGIGRGKFLLALVILPLYIPVLILGTLATTYALYETSPNGYLALLLALLIASVLVLPTLMAISLRINLSA